MKPTLHIRWKRLRNVNLRLESPSLGGPDASTIATHPSQSGAFATLLVEWKQAQMVDAPEEVAEPKSA